jgi:O-antigen/teichoic acid export membrane protein
MRHTLKRFSRMTAGYGLIHWAGPMLSLIFTPIITRALTPADYGTTDYILTIASALGTVAAFALPQALTTHYNDHPDTVSRHRLVGSTLLPALLIGALSGIGLFITAPQIAQWSFGNQTYTQLFQLLGATLVFGVCGSVLTTAAQVDLRVRWGMVLSLTNTLCIVFGNVLFIVVLRLGVTGMILTPVVAGTTVCVVALILTRSLIGRPKPDFIRLLVRSGSLLLPTVFSAWMLQVVDRMFLINYVSTTELGYYSIANKIASLLGVALVPLYVAWTPLALSIQHEPDAPHRYNAMARYLVAATLCGSLALGLFSTEILMILTRAPYLPAAPYVGVLTYIYVFSTINMTLNIGGMINKQLKSMSGAVVAGALVNFVLNAVLIPRYGVWGASIATVIGYAVSTAVLYWRIRSRLQAPYPMRLFLAAIAVQSVLLGIGLMIPPLSFPIRAGLKLFIFALLPLAFVVLGLITRFEMQQAGQLVRQQISLVLTSIRRG